ncbi:MAG: DUF4105 domain-containing protein [Victivallaceae bacterium]|nr:DUF4105 domain-containing protein [Victivallaceae bacterium]
MKIFCRRDRRSAGGFAAGVPAVIGLPPIRWTLTVVMAVWGAFCCGILFYHLPLSGLWRFVPSAALAADVTLCLMLWRKSALIPFLLAAELLAINSAYLTLVQPSNDRDWQPSFARNPRSRIDGNRLTVFNVRDFRYRSETDFDPVYVNETYDLEKIDGLYFIVVHWGGDAIGHTMISFSFSDGKSLAFSMETRLDQADVQGAVPGLFRQFELLCIAGTERDLLGLRTNFRHEQVYFYRSAAGRGPARRHLLAMAGELNSLDSAPEFYNTLTKNCTTSLIPILSGRPPTHRLRLLCNGFSDFYAFRENTLDNPSGIVEFKEFKERHHLNPAVEKLDIYAPDFDYSAFIRKVVDPGAEQ